jgi:4-hydroxybenzoate polyprenyltransferase
MIFRPLNILIILLVGLVFWKLSNQFNENLGIEIPPSNVIWVYIIISVLIAAAGYLINDYYDQEIDKINKPHKKYPFTPRQTWNIYFPLNALAVFLGVVFLNIEMTFIFVVLPIWVLWFYSFTLKRMPIIGNLAIATLAIWLPAGIIVLNTVPESLSNNQSEIKGFMLLLLGCSFLTTFAREIIKDIQDIKGDEKMGVKTFPSFVGKTFASILAIGLIAICFLVWNGFYMKYNTDFEKIIHFPFILTTLSLLAAILFLFLGKKWEIRTQRSSLLLKASMLFAIITGFLI